MDGERSVGREDGGGRGRGRGRGGGRGRGRGGRGGTGALEHCRPVTLGFKALQDLQTKTPDEIVLDLMSTRRFPATEALLTQQSVLRDDWVVLIVSVLAKACSCSSKEYLLKLFNLLPKSSFLNLHLRTYLNRLSACRMHASEVATFLSNVVTIMNELLRRFPNSYADLPVPDLYCGTKILSDTGKLTDGTLAKEVEELFKLRNQKAEELKKLEEQKQHRRRPRRDGEKIISKRTLLVKLSTVK